MYSCANYPRGCRGRVNRQGAKCSDCVVSDIWDSTQKMNKDKLTSRTVFELASPGFCFTIRSATRLQASATLRALRRAFQGTRTRAVMRMPSLDSPGKKEKQNPVSHWVASCRLGHRNDLRLPLFLCLSYASPEFLYHIRRLSAPLICWISGISLIPRLHIGWADVCLGRNLSFENLRNSAHFTFPLVLGLFLEQRTPSFVSVLQNRSHFAFAWLPTDMDLPLEGSGADGLGSFNSSWSLIARFFFFFAHTCAPLVLILIS